MYNIIAISLLNNICINNCDAYNDRINDYIILHNNEDHIVRNYGNDNVNIDSVYANNEINYFVMSIL